MGKPFKFRPGQRPGVIAILGALAKKFRSPFFQMAVATGKTLVALFVIERLARAGKVKRCVLLAHTEELLDQPRKLIEKTPWFPTLRKMGVGIVRGKYSGDDARVIVATVQTLSKSLRIQRVLDHGPIDLLWIDEAHHAGAQTYKTVQDELKRANPRLIVLGCSATPRGGSGKHGLDHVFDTVAYTFNMGDAIEAGVLVDFDVLEFSLDAVSLKNVDIISGDYDPKQVGDLLKASNANDIIVAKWIEFGEDRLTLSYSPTVDEAAALAKRFMDEGVKAEIISGETPEPQRKRILRAFRRGEIRVLCNVNVFLEGTDIPEVSCIINARPTRSATMYVQMIGRGLRIHPGKEKTIVMDMRPRARDLMSAEEAMLGQGLVHATSKGGKTTYTAEGHKRAKKAGRIVDPESVIMKRADGLRRHLGLNPLDDGKLLTIQVGRSTVLLARRDGRQAESRYWVYDVQIRQNEMEIAGEWVLPETPERVTPLGKAESWGEIEEAARSLKEDAERRDKERRKGLPAWTWRTLAKWAKTPKAQQPPTSGQLSTLEGWDLPFDLPKTRREAEEQFARGNAIAAWHRYLDEHDHDEEEREAMDRPLSIVTEEWREKRREAERKREAEKERHRRLRERGLELFGEWGKR